MSGIENRLIDPGFWHQPLADRMLEFAEIRELGPFVPVDFHNELSPGDLEGVLRKVRPDLVLVTTSGEDIGRTGVPGLELLVESLRGELEATASVPIIAVARTGA